MSLSDVDYVREVGRLPDWSRLPEERILPHLDAAARMLRSWIGEYESTSDTDKAASCKYAEACITMALVLPSLNTFYTQEIVGLQKDVGEVEFLFTNPSDQQRLYDHWLGRAKDAIETYKDNQTDNPDTGQIGWYSI